ncbi:hypothetical protein NPIL_461611 [Nephila pilipes]|uniref:Uncharacterized protein n=1 Tax=Nephila pilipes TaxID=299642 RepID=A0A8X6R2R6_NEPPI|nr:hypothetical protein NPIL_461611 [Nephila pilipes]
MRHFQETLWTEDPEYINPLSSNTYQKEYDHTATDWEKVAEYERYCAAMEEKYLAVQAGEVGGDGIPMLTVVVDGC